MATHEMSFTRLLDAPADKLFRCWTTPDLLKQWFAPHPWTVPSATVDLKPGGASNITMRSPEGQDMPCPGQYLEVIPNRKLVFTDAFVGGWMPKDGAPFMVATITFEPDGNKTHYTAAVRHWSEADRARHEQMGFHPGWNKCADQLEALAKTI